MEHVNVYDWDKTIFPVDSTAAFCLWCARRHPRVLLHFLGLIPILPAFLSGRLEKTRFKERLYGFLRYIPDIDAEVQTFWDKNFHRIHKWYMAQTSPDDIVISVICIFAGCRDSLGDLGNHIVHRNTLFFFHKL